jgi:hypothetical protein
MTALVASCTLRSGCEPRPDGEIQSLGSFLGPIKLDRGCWSWSLPFYSQQDSRQSSKIKIDGESHPMDTAVKMLLTVLLIDDIATRPLFLLKEEEAASVNFIGRATIPADMKVVAYNSCFRFTNPFARRTTSARQLALSRGSMSSTVPTRRAGALPTSRSGILLALAPPTRSSTES